MSFSQNLNHLRRLTIRTVLMLGVCVGGLFWLQSRGQADSDFLVEVIKEFKKHRIRTSIFVGTEQELIEGAAKTGSDRVELYTEPYATSYPVDRAAAIKPFVDAAVLARDLGLELNAGHDLSLENLRYMKEQIPWLKEVSIGHALIADALYYGLQNTIQMYLRQLRD